MSSSAAAVSDATGALEELRTALLYLPLSGAVTAAATARRGEAAASVAHQFARHLVAIGEAVEGMSGDRVAASRREEALTVAESARVNGAARARDAAEHYLEALVLEPTRRRHVSMAAAVLAHASLADEAGGLEQWRSAVAAAEVVGACDEERPPEECHHLLLGHARNLMDLGLWGLAREAARLAVLSRGERAAEDKAAGALAREAEEKMDKAADAAMLKRAGWDGDFDKKKKAQGKKAEL